MKNKNVGYLISGIAVVLIGIVFLFNRGLNKIVSQSCVHGPTCPMYDTISFQTYLSLLIAGLILVIGLFLIFSKESEKIIFKTKTVKQKRKPVSTKGLETNEKKVVEILQKENGVVFQKDLMNELGIGKVGITRLLDKLEAKQIIERKRRGMNNIVVLKS